VGGSGQAITPGVLVGGSGRPVTGVVRGVVRGAGGGGQSAGTAFAMGPTTPLNGLGARRQSPALNTLVAQLRAARLQVRRAR